MAESDLSAEVNATTVLPPPTIGDLSVDSDGNVVVPWTNNDDSADGGIDVERSTDGFTNVTIVVSGLSPSTTSYTDTSVSQGTTYEYRIERNTDHATATSGASDTVRPPKRLTRTATLTGDGQLDTTRNGIAKLRLAEARGNGEIDVSRTTTKVRDGVVTGDGRIDATRSGLTKTRGVTLTGNGEIDARCEFREVFPSEETTKLSWDFSDDPLGFVSEWFDETYHFDGQAEALTVVVDTKVTTPYELLVQYDTDGDDEPEYTTKPRTVRRDGQTLSFDEFDGSGRYRFVVRDLRPEVHLRALTVGPTRF